MTDLTFCYLHMTPARIAALDYFEEVEERSTIGRVDEDGIEIPIGAMPPDPDDGDNLPSQIHPSFPYGNPFRDKTLTAAAYPTNPFSTRALYEDAEMEGVGLKSKHRWKDLGTNMLLPIDFAKEEETKAALARSSANPAITQVDSDRRRAQDDVEEDGDEDEEDDMNDSDITTAGQTTVARFGQ